ncbi:DUF2889 domain-containing protein [Ramlibacter sp. AN1015]|uniref:DUF2889 domain-containing protein n=1 Tax=Ramlibacter sp. AN1015 TaxID=3133428 RepID=UPI0030BE6144
MSPHRDPTREHLHTRRIEFNGFRRSDGLWDMEAELRDWRHYDTEVHERGLLPAGESVHHMRITLTLDDALVVRAASARMLAAPFGTCREAEEALQPMVGARIGPGWRRTVDACMGGERGCTHLRELLVNLATAALQTIPTWHGQQRRRTGEPSTERPYFLGQCHGWRLDGPVVLRYYPQFHEPAAAVPPQE